jgi:hypothetical protein
MPSPAATRGVRGRTRATKRGVKHGWVDFAGGAIHVDERRAEIERAIRGAPKAVTRPNNSSTKASSDLRKETGSSRV